MAVTEKELGATACALVDYACGAGMIGAADRVWAYNTVLDLIGAEGPAPLDGWVLGSETAGGDFDLDAALAVLADASAANGRVEDTATGRDRAAMRVMGALTPRPSEIVAAWRDRVAEGGPRAATDWFYRLCCDAGYVRRSAIARNIAWTTPTRWGDLEITINLSKPEKDPRDIARAGAAKATGEKYPACQLCIENEGYSGRGAASPRGDHPARQNLRIVPLELGGERWGFQYSPYAYFNEHCIAMSAHHRPMHIDRASLTCLLDFVDALPHYFIGSNADLPIVGGSILSHDHFQGGAHEFPMMHARVAESFTMPGYEDIEGAVLTWPLSVLRLRGADRGRLLDACVHVIDTWRGWTDEEAGVIARTPDGTPHNTVTPVIRRIDADGAVGGDRYEAYLALRCNITSEEHPLGVFHPHAEYHHIKKENIGLIEVMGLAILPARLKEELACVGAHLHAAACAGQSPIDVLATLEGDRACASHATWATGVYANRSDELAQGDVGAILHEEVGAVFGHVLENAGVYKWDDAGRAAQRRFIDAL